MLSIKLQSVNFLQIMKSRTGDQFPRSLPPHSIELTTVLVVLINSFWRKTINGQIKAHFGLLLRAQICRRSFLDLSSELVKHFCWFFYLRFYVGELRFNFQTRRAIRRYIPYDDDMKKLSNCFPQWLIDFLLFKV